ncbi:MAG: AtpZ/AtpI family protein [Planctomycetota bacterium]
MRYSGIGLDFAVTVGLFTWAGWWLDGKLRLAGSFPLLLILGVFGGMVFGIYRMKRALESGSRDSTKAGKGSEDDRPKNPPPPS